MGGWNWDIAIGALPAMLKGLMYTFLITIAGSMLAYVLGLLFAVLRRARIPVVGQLLYLLIEFIRSTPLLIQIFFAYYGLGSLGILLPPLLTGILVIGLHYACYTSEVYRAGIDAIPKGQWEAATALSLPRRRTWTAVILPQAVPRVVPSLGNYTISMFKETPLLLAIGVVELVNAAQEQGAEVFRSVEVYTMAGLFFLLLSYPSSLLVRKLERRVGSI